MLGPKKVGNPRKEKIKNRKTKSECHEMAPKPSKERVMHEGDNPSF